MRNGLSPLISSRSAMSSNACTISALVSLRAGAARGALAFGDGGLAFAGLAAMSALRLQDERPRDSAAAGARPRRVGGGGRQDLAHRRDHGRFRRGEKALAVGAREIRDRDDLALPPEQLVRKARNVAHVYPGADDPA